MNYLSVCSGVEAATVAWHHMGWNPVGFSEIEKFPSQVLAHRYPSVTNFGDMSKYKEWQIDGTIGLLVGGTPCQSFSVAGLRKGLEDPRGNLALTYVGILDHFRPKWFVWENVPGVLSSGGGRDFGSFLGAVAQCGYGFAYRVLDAQYFGVPQRRRRVFVVGCLGSWESAAKVLFESESLRRDTPKSRKKGERVTARIESRSPDGSSTIETLMARDYKGIGNQDLKDGRGLILDPIVYKNNSIENSIVGALDTECGGKKLSHQSINSGHIFAVYENHPSDSRVREMGEVCQTVTSTWGSGGGNIPFVQNMPIALAENTIGRQPMNGGNGDGFTENGPMYTLNATGVHGIAYSFDSLASNSMKSPNPNSGCRQVELSKTIDTTYPCPSKNQGGIGIIQNMAVRRLTPVECERLQGFPDNYTNIRENCPDGPRYKAMGNSMAVPVMRWIGERINKVNNEQ